MGCSSETSMKSGQNSTTEKSGLNVPPHLPPRRGEGEGKGEKRGKMYQYLLRRLLITVPTVLGISVVLFSILALAPGDPFEELALHPDIPTEVRLHLRQQFGLD